MPREWESDYKPSGMTLLVAGKGAGQWIGVRDGAGMYSPICTTKPEDQVDIADAILPEGFEVVEKGTLNRLQRTISEDCKDLNAANSDITDLKMALAHERGCTVEELDVVLRPEASDPEPEAMPMDEEFDEMAYAENAVWAIEHMPDEWSLGVRVHFHDHSRDRTEPVVYETQACKVFRDRILAERKAEAEAEQWSEPVDDMNIARLREVASAWDYDILATGSPTGNWDAAYYYRRPDGQPSNLIAHTTNSHAAIWALRTVLRHVARKLGRLSLDNLSIWLGDGPMLGATSND